MRLLQGLLVLSVLAATGCAVTPPVPPPEYPGIEQSASVSIQDLRPATESQKEIFSLLVTSSAYGLYRIEDAATKPTGMRLLAHRAYETFPELKNQPSIKIQHFVAYSNLQSHLRKTSILAGLTGPIGVALLASDPPKPGEVLVTPVDSTLFDKTSGDEEYTRALFTEQENPERVPVNLVWIDTEMLGKRVASRCLVPPQADKPYMYLVEAFDLCIARHLDLYKAQSLETAAK